MNDMMKGFLAALLRKIIFGAGAVYVAWLVEKGLATTGDIERFIEIAVAVILLVVPAVWTLVKEWIAKRKAA